MRDASGEGRASESFRTAPPNAAVTRVALRPLQASVASDETPVDKATALVSGLDDINVAWEALTTASGSECD